MSKVKLGINGFGRIGRIVFRETFNRDNVEVVAINDLMEVEYIAYMLKYDSTHGKFNGEVSVENGNLVVNGKSIRVSAEREPKNIAWGAINAEYVAEATGIFLTKEATKGHLE
ncbi:MAG: glyceraldehyde 3-phosphate dehydrogenase N-terminal domain-containing protein, partial [Flavobacterium sp.]|nr:glyceraldehyde 3-phosphate dehydrogenase N-terminal domain-containing protein [Flavobacterium sp.]